MTTRRKVNHGIKEARKRPNAITSIKGPPTLPPKRTAPKNTKSALNPDSPRRSESIQSSCHKRGAIQAEPKHAVMMMAAMELFTPFVRPPVVATLNSKKY